jgi:hypothetical protein
VKQFLFSFLLLSILSCSHKDNDYKKIIPETEMVSILIDLHLADGIIRSFIVHKKPIYVKDTFYNTIFKKHSVTDRQFEWNLIHYSEEKKISLFYEKAISELTTKKATFEQKMLKENKRPSVTPVRRIEEE